MRLRARFHDLIKARCETFLPEALATVWDTAGIVVVIESLKFSSDGGIYADEWEISASFEGVLRLELHGDGIDTLVFEPLVSDLIDLPPLLTPDPDAESGDLSEWARAVLIELRDTVRDRDVVSALRFDVKGAILTRDTAPDAPEAMISQAPEIGPDHVDDYKPLDEWTGAA